MKGADAIAGSMFILLNSNGNMLPTMAATMILPNNDTETMAENVKNLS